MVSTEHDFMKQKNYSYLFLNLASLDLGLWFMAFILLGTNDNWFGSQYLDFVLALLNFCLIEIALVYAIAKMEVKNVKVLKAKK